MELDIKPRLSSKGTVTSKEAISGYTGINLYTTVPTGQLSLEECEDLFRQRIEALNIMETVTDTSIGQAGVITNSLRDIKSYIFKTNCIIVQHKNVRQRELDHLSHMLVRLYCIHNSALWDWFKRCERKLLLYRLRDQALSLSGPQLANILRNFDFKFEHVSGTELSELLREHIIGWDSYGDRPSDAFKIGFEYALKFLSRRSVGLKDGYAWLTRNDIISVICDVFADHLESERTYGLQHLNSKLLQVGQILESLDLVFEDYRLQQEEIRRKNKREQDNSNRGIYDIDIDSIETIKNEHYPPCMRHLHETLKKDHHLKHYGRLHYGTFLRSAGVDIDTALKFWRDEFTKNTTNRINFDRDHKYNIRHIYGLEGHKKALSCFTCDKIINDNAPGMGDKHGCPFKHFDDKNLKLMLGDHGLKEVDIESIISEKKMRGSKEACASYFKIRKGVDMSDAVRAPIQFYQQSVLISRAPKTEANLDQMEVELEDWVPDEDLIEKLDKSAAGDPVNS